MNEDGTYKIDVPNEDAATVGSFLNSLELKTDIAFVDAENNNLTLE